MSVVTSSRSARLMENHILLYPITQTAPLDPTLTDAVVEFLGVEQTLPSLAVLDQLVDAYTRHVPWESAFRIVKRAQTAHTVDCPRWPQEFWADALERGGGGTCFESNYAFFSLLRALGYDGYLTINDMGSMCGCHTAIVVYLNDERWLADVGIPLYVPIPLSVRATARESRFHTYTITPQGDDIYAVSRDRHPSPTIFTLLDRPVSDDAYRHAVTQDYEPSGHFLNRIIVTRIMDDHVWRFNSRVTPPLLESFGAQPTSMPVLNNPANIIASRFEMDRETVARAFVALGLEP